LTLPGREFTLTSCCPASSPSPSILFALSLLPGKLAVRLAIENPFSLLNKPNPGLTVFQGVLDGTSA